VPERYGNNMTPGSLINFMIDGSTKKFSAKVIANENDIAEETRSLKVRAVVDKNDGNLIAGAFAKVQITLGKEEAALMIPTQAIIPQARNKKVMALRNGVTALETVVTGIRDSSMVEVTSGLKQGDTILLTGLLSTKPGSKVQVKIIGNK
jgi:membrane fusion protein, multidrug efflux system